MTNPPPAVVGTARNLKLWEAMGAVGAAAQALIGVVAWMDTRNSGSNITEILKQGSSAIFILLVLVVILITVGRALRKLPIFSAMQQWLSIWAVIAGATWVFLTLGWFELGSGAPAEPEAPKVAEAAPAPKAAPVAEAVPEEAPVATTYAPAPIPTAGMAETADSMEAWVRSGAAAASAGSLLPHPTFDCASATQSSELAICGDETLANLDRRLAEVYVRRLNVNPLTRENQQAWIGARNAACGADAACLRKMMTARMVALQNGTGIPVPPPAAAAPAAPAAPAPAPAPARK